jgi:cyclohexanecarboxylate-CoA ligase
MNLNRFDVLAHAAAMRSRGFWQDRTIDSLFKDALAKSPQKTALIAYREDRSRSEPIVLKTYAQLAVEVASVAGSLRGLGIARGDIVAVQLPNWWEFVVMTLAVGRVGAIVNPLMPIFRERELSFMLALSEAKLLLVPKIFRGFDHEEMIKGIRARLPQLQHVVVVDGLGPNSFERMLMKGAGSELALDQSGKLRADQEPGLRPDELAVLMFTSGTTGEPKGVMHSCNTLIACITSLAGRFHLAEDEVLLCCSPMGHMSGFAAMFLQSIFLGATLVLQDVWSPAEGVAIMRAQGVTHTAASTPFLADICEAIATGAPRPDHMRTFLCAGAPIPPVLIERALKSLGIPVSSLWGMTESLTSTLTEPERAHEKSSTSDGRAVQGVEVKIVDATGKVLPPGQTGSLMVRGAQMFLGYFKRPELSTFDEDGWFDSGDLAYADNESYIRINGRTKDVLIRGGENVPVFEIESLLYKHPALAEVAIVGFPDARLGERSCAFVVLRAGESFDLQVAQSYMAQCQVAKQYWPERVEILPALPRTASGKIQKFALRELAMKDSNSWDLSLPRPD